MSPCHLIFGSFGRRVWMINFQADDWLKHWDFAAQSPHFNTMTSLKLPGPSFVVHKIKGWKMSFSFKEIAIYETSRHTAAAATWIRIWDVPNQTTLRTARTRRRTRPGTRREELETATMSVRWRRKPRGSMYQKKHLMRRGVRQGEPPDNVDRLEMNVKLDDQRSHKVDVSVPRHEKMNQIQCSGAINPPIIYIK